MTGPFTPSRNCDGPAMHSAYLIVVCDVKTNAVKSARIWSSPEWEQSICIPDRTFVAYEVKDVDYQSARDALVVTISQPRSRYHWLLKHLDARAAGNVRPPCVIGDSWTYGQPTEPGDYEWASMVHSLNPDEVTVYRGYNGNVQCWGRDVWFRKIAGARNAE